MHMTRYLLALYPRQWRERYGEEFAALLDDTPPTLPMVVDVVYHAAALHAGRHQNALRVCAAVMVSALVEIVSVRAGLTTNILWAPTDPVRASALVAAVGPWLVLAQAAFAHRRRPHNDPDAGSATSW